MRGIQASGKGISQINFSDQRRTPQRLSPQPGNRIVADVEIARNVPGALTARHPLCRQLG
jgi:hypothetical protein